VGPKTSRQPAPALHSRPPIKGQRCQRCQKGDLEADCARIFEVGYISLPVLQTFGDVPAGRIAVISPGEPLHRKDAQTDWVLNWHSVCTRGETILGSPPRELGPEITQEVFKRAIEAQLRQWAEDVRAPWVAYVPAHQGYIVVTVCRALYALAAGEQTTKEDAVAWAAEHFPEWAPFVKEALIQHRAEVNAPHRAAIQFVDYALTQAERLDEG
jgi:hypothetical protein